MRENFKRNYKRILKKIRDNYCTIRDTREWFDLRDVAKG